MQIRISSESLAFLDSGRVESEKTNHKLYTLVNMMQKVVNREYLVNLSVNLFDYFGAILSYVVIAIPIFGGVYDDLDGSELSVVISQVSFHVGSYVL